MKETVEKAARVVKEFERRGRLVELVAFAEIYFECEDDNYTGVVEAHFREGRLKRLKREVSRTVLGT